MKLIYIYICILHQWNLRGYYQYTKRIEINRRQQNLIRTIETTLLYFMRNRRKIEMLGEEKVVGICTEREERMKWMYTDEIRRIGKNEKREREADTQPKILELSYQGNVKNKFTVKDKLICMYLPISFFFKLIISNLICKYWPDLSEFNFRVTLLHSTFLIHFYYRIVFFL